MKKYLLVLVPILAGLFIFQNCAQQPNNTASGASVSSYESGLPFAYAAKPDTLAYMSCQNMQVGTFDSNAFFTFRMGAYTSGFGMAMTQAFYDKTLNYPVNERASLFRSSDVNANTSYNLSVRKSESFQTYMDNGSGFTMGSAVDTFLPQLDNPWIAGPLAAAAPGVARGYFPSAEDHRLMEASLRFYNPNFDMQDFRANFNSSTTVLVAGYSDGSDVEGGRLRSPADYPKSISTPLTSSQTSSNTIFGSAFRVKFTNPSGFGNANVRVLLGPLQEQNLVTKQIDSSWNCDPKYQFTIVRAEDYRRACPVSYDQAASAEELDALYKIRRVLKTEYWYVNAKLRCVVPRNTGDYCYGPSPGPIEYTSSCSGSNCPHFVSLCTRD